MNRILTILLAATVLAATATAQAQVPNERREAMREKMKNMTPEEKAAAKEKARAKWESMSPEEQATARKRFAERHPGAAEKMQERAASAPK